jgi:hypothetical protein
MLRIGPDCEWIGPNIDFCGLGATIIEKAILPAQNQGRQNGRGQMQQHESEIAHEL